MRTIQKTTLEYWALIAEWPAHCGRDLSQMIWRRKLAPIRKSSAARRAITLSLSQRPFEMVIENEGARDDPKKN